MLVPRTSTRPSVNRRSVDPGSIWTRNASNRTNGSAPSGGEALRAVKRVSPSGPRISSGMWPAFASSALSRSGFDGHVEKGGHLGAVLALHQGMEPVDDLLRGTTVEGVRLECGPELSHQGCRPHASANHVAHGEDDTARRRTRTCRTSRHLPPSPRRRAGIEPRPLGRGSVATALEAGCVGASPRCVVPARTGEPGQPRGRRGRPPAGAVPRRRLRRA